MKSIRKRRALRMAILTSLIVGCEQTGRALLGTYSAVDEAVFRPVRLKETSEIQKQEKLATIKFVSDNWANVTAEMAKGEAGQYLSKLASLLRIDDGMDKFAFYALTKAKFKQLVTPQTTPEQLVARLEAEASQLYKESTTVSGKYNKFLTIGYVTQSWSELNNDMAKGEGQFLRTLGQYFAIPIAQEAAFFAMTKSKFKQLIPSSQTTPEQLVDNLEIEVAKLGVTLKN
jgi:hypothetical protein